MTFSKPGYSICAIESTKLDLGNEGYWGYSLRGYVGNLGVMLGLELSFVLGDFGIDLGGAGYHGNGCFWCCCYKLRFRKYRRKASRIERKKKVKKKRVELGD
ncbi:hypothetical protein LIER_40528 [Lithospermum erythrorhizon]|uniref:Uncharacterized protein n=1 Tax=Lithospermum erythrorhizon TaxID=34254 RepID=A0AAV3R1L9_LITER